MSGTDDNVAVIGDWVPPNPSPRTFFSAMLGDDISLREPASENTADGLFLATQEQMTLRNNDKKEVAQAGVSTDQLAGLGPFSEQKSNSRGGLLERMAARAGFNAPKLNTESIRSSNISLNPDVRSPYLTIPPGLSPTTLLDSPVFLSNSLVSFSLGNYYMIANFSSLLIN